MSHTLPTRAHGSRVIALGGVLTALLAVVLSAFSAVAPAAHAATARPAAIRTSATLGRASLKEARAMRIAVNQHGKPYRYGAAGPSAYDCSGLTSYAFHHAGFLRMPRTAAAQAHFVRHIRRSRMRRGDLIFFTSGGRVYHVGMYAGFRNGRRLVLHAPYPGQRVRTQPLWTNAWFPGTLRYR